MPSVNVLPGSGNVIGGQGVAVKTWGARPADRVLLQPSGVKMALGENPKRVYGSKKKTPSTRLGNAAKMREAFVQARTYRQKRDRDEGERDLRWEILTDVLDGKFPARCHAHRADDILTALRISREIGNRRGESWLLADMGLFYHNRGEDDRAVTFSRQALALVRIC